MSALVIPTSVFVPYQWINGNPTKRDDIPRFATSKECLRYFQQHPEHSARKEHIEFQERSDKEFIDEFCIGVGTPHYRSNYT